MLREGYDEIQYNTIQYNTIRFISTFIHVNTYYKYIECLKWKVEKDMSEANYKLIRDTPIITHINLHNEYLKKQKLFS